MKSPDAVVLPWLPPWSRMLRWPVPALLAWLLAWGVCIAARGAGIAPAGAWVAGLCVGVGCAASIRGGWRRLIVAGGFPVSSLALGLAMPGWGWVVAGALLLLAYPLGAWRDAPFFPTPADALRTLPEVLRLGPGARVLDAGCGLGHGLHALRAAYPGARIDGIERSWLLASASRWRCRDARIHRGDMWRASWRGYDLVYLFQRPESMSRAMAKAIDEMSPGGWLVSLEFEVPAATPHARLQPVGGKAVWVYRVGATSRRSTAARRGR